LLLLSILLSVTASSFAARCYCGSRPDEWAQRTRSSGYAAGLGHPCDGADIDVGPLLQTHKLLIP